MLLFPEGKAVNRESFEEYCSSGGYAVSFKPSQILDEVTASGLRGRGGAGFPVGKKWRVAAETPATSRHVVCNAGEDEPGSFKDRILIEHRPHLVLEGAILAARAIDAEELHFYINENYSDCIARLSQAIDQANQSGYVGSLKASI